jgi:hypothetical protein
LFTFFLEFALFFPFFSARIAKLKKLETKKTFGWGRGWVGELIQLFKPEVSPN